jgi:hypothetical protein
LKRKRENGKTSKPKKRKRIKLWSYKDSKKLKNKNKFNNKKELKL